MTRTHLIKFWIDRLSREGGRNNQATVIAFIEALMDNPQTELQNIKMQYQAELIARQQEQITYKQKLDSDVVSIQSLNVADL